jgi:hypothetical protein
MEGYEGDPVNGCRLREIGTLQVNLYTCRDFLINFHLFKATQRPIEPCNPSPCGLNSQCRVKNNQAVCSCLSGYLNSPPNCRPECFSSSDCDQDKACYNEKCRNPCIEKRPCAEQNARCTVVNHNAICTCSNGYEGDPFESCSKISDSKSVRKFFLLINLLKTLLFFSSQLQWNEKIHAVHHRVVHTPNVARVQMAQLCAVARQE